MRDIIFLLGMTESNQNLFTYKTHIIGDLFKSVTAINTSDVAIR